MRIGDTVRIVRVDKQTPHGLLYRLGEIRQVSPQTSVVRVDLKDYVIANECLQAFGPHTTTNPYNGCDHA